MLSWVAHARVALAQFDADVMRSINELLARPNEQAAVGGVRNGLGLHRRVQRRGVKAGTLDDSPALGRLDALGQQPFAAGLADALAPRSRLDGSQGRSCWK